MSATTWLAEDLTGSPTMYEHDCISNIVETEPQLRSSQGQVFMPLLDHIWDLMDGLNEEERTVLWIRLTYPNASAL